MVTVRHSASLWGWQAHYEIWITSHDMRLNRTLWRPTKRWACWVATRRQRRCDQMAAATNGWEKC